MCFHVNDYQPRKLILCFSDSYAEAYDLYYKVGLLLNVQKKKKYQVDYECVRYNSFSSSVSLYMYKQKVINTNMKLPSCGMFNLSE